MRCNAKSTSDHRDFAVLDRGDEPGGVDGQKLRVVLDAGQQVHRP
jgi:hypothetical protein